MKAADVLFWVMALATVGSAAGVAFTRDIVRSSLSLLGALLAVGGLYVLLGADFLGITQLLLYVGGVLVLLLFAVMLTHRGGDRRGSNPFLGAKRGVVLLVALGLGLGGLAFVTPWGGSLDPQEPPTTAKLGEIFLSSNLLVFELWSLLLLVALVGAVVVARKEVEE